MEVPFKSPKEGEWRADATYKKDTEKVESINGKGRCGTMKGIFDRNEWLENVNKPQFLIIIRPRIWGEMKGSFTEIVQAI